MFAVNTGRHKAGPVKPGPHHGWMGVFEQAAGRSSSWTTHSGEDDHKGDDALPSAPAGSQLTRALPTMPMLDAFRSDALLKSLDAQA